MSVLALKQGAKNGRDDMITPQYDPEVTAVLRLKLLVFVNSLVVRVVNEFTNTLTIPCSRFPVSFCIFNYN